LRAGAGWASWAPFRSNRLGEPMRRGMRAMGILLAAVTGRSIVGCEPSSDCEEIFTCPPATSGGGGGSPSVCIPSQKYAPVEDSCGVFVSSSKGQDSSIGTKGSPLKTLQHAIEQAKGRPVYACAEAFAGSIVLTNGGAIYGGLDCTKQWV